MKDSSIFLYTGETATAMLTFSQTEGDLEESTTSSESDTEADPLWLLVLRLEKARPQPCLFVREGGLVGEFSMMITSDVLSELFVEEAIEITTSGETFDPQPLR